MNCYVVCENVYRDDTLQHVNIIGVGETLEDAKALIESNREELKRLFHGKFEADFYDYDGSHKFCTMYGDVYCTCACKTEYRKMTANESEKVATNA